MPKNQLNKADGCHVLILLQVIGFLNLFASCYYVVAFTLICLMNTSHLHITVHICINIYSVSFHRKREKPERRNNL